MKQGFGRHHLPLIILQLVLSKLTCLASVIVNEVAYKGSEGQCDGEDWIELLNTDSGSAVNLLNYTIHDDNGPFEYPNNIPSMSIAPGEYKVLCRKVDFEFGIGSTDTITLLDESGSELSSVSLPGTGRDDLTYAYFDDGYKYTETPTPGAVNSYTEPKSLQQQLQEQNEAGEDFFLNGMDPAGSSDVFSKVVDIHIDIDADNLALITDHPTWQEYASFTQISVSNSGDDTTVISTGGTGRIRTKGQSTLTNTACFGLKNVPFVVKFDSQFYGMKTAYFRNHLYDASYMREYGAHAMLKKFGLPYIRSRPIRLYFNGEYIGFYTMMEAPDQPYVMQRSFGAFDAELTSLYKMKTQFVWCASYFKGFSSEELEYYKNLPVPDPYYFERGDHRADVPDISDANDPEGVCMDFYNGETDKEFQDFVIGYLQNDSTCSLASVNLGMVDRKLGPKSSEESMRSFLDSTFYSLDTGIGQVDRDLVNDDQWIKNLAVYAVTLNMDSPMNNLNNWYLASASGGENKDWSIVQWDHNNILTPQAADGLCDPGCSSNYIYWPILRPTCGGPVETHPVVGILSDASSKEKYLAYVEEFANLLDGGLIDDLRAYGNDIKQFVVADPLFPEYYSSLEAYEDAELGTTFDDYFSATSPFLKVTEARLEQVKEQLQAIKNNNLPRDGIYEEAEKCPDWRISEPLVESAPPTEAPSVVTSAAHHPNLNLSFIAAFFATALSWFFTIYE